jgi:hypothetical protein
VPEELLPLLVSPEWVEARKRLCGVTSQIYLSKVLGEFFRMSPTGADARRTTAQP